MTETSITETLLRSLRQVLPRFVRKLNETDIVTGTEAIRSPLDRGWTYPRDEARIRAQYESECG